MRRIKSWFPYINDEEFQQLKGANIKRKAGYLVFSSGWLWTKFSIFSVFALCHC
jgi:hypothetical protein